MDKKSILIVSKNDVFNEKVKNSSLKDTFDMEVTDCITVAVGIVKDASINVIIIVDDKDEIKPFALIHNLNLMQIDVPCIIVSDSIGADYMSLSYEVGAYEVLDINDFDDIIDIIKNI